jgi:hypothetical protein
MCAVPGSVTDYHRPLAPPPPEEPPLKLSLDPLDPLDPLDVSPMIHDESDEPDRVAPRMAARHEGLLPSRYPTTNIASAGGTSVKDAATKAIGVPSRARPRPRAIEVISSQ